MCEYPAEVCLRYLILYLYEEYGTTILVATVASVKCSAFDAWGSRPAWAASGRSPGEDGPAGRAPLLDPDIGHPVGLMTL